MKWCKVLISVFCFVFVGSFFYQCTEKPNLPVTSSKYSIAEIDSIYQLHRSEHKHDVSPPFELLSIFEQDFPNAKDVDYEETSHLYRIEFEIGSDDYKAFYDRDFQLVLYKYEMSRRDLPAVVNNAVLNKYPNFDIDDVDVYNKANVLFYEIEIEKGKLEYKVIVSDAGIILSERGR